MASGPTVLLVVGLCVMGIALSVDVAKPETYKVVEHKNLLVICNVTASPETYVYWTKNDTKRSFLQNGTKLELIDITRDEKGQYVCHAVNTSAQPDNTTEWNRTVDVIQVDVEYPAEFLVCSIGPTTIKAGHSYSVYFDIVGHPDPTWEIRNNRTGAAITRANLPASGSLSAIEVRCGDDGLIICTGYNYLNHGKNTTGGAYINVLCGPEPSPYIYPSYTSESFLHGTANFTMDFVGNPTPSLTWTRDDGQSLPWSRINQIDTDSTSTLVFTDVQVEDFTSYTLTMANQYNSSKSTFQLEPKGGPQTPTDLTFYDVTYDSVTLSWTAGYDMGVWQRFSICRLLNGNQYITISDTIYDYSHHEIGQRFTHVVLNLESSTFYNLTIQSQNDHSGYVSGLARPFATFTTPDDPYPEWVHHSSSTGVVVGCVLGGFGFIAFLAFLVYILRYRKMRTAYTKA